MANNKGDRVVSVRLSAKEVERLEDISEQWDISISSLVRSFVSSCLYSLPSDVPDWIKRGQTKAVKKVQTVKRSLPDEDNKAEAGVQQEEKTSPQQSLPKVSGNAPCPCGSVHPGGKRKKYKHCCGK